jgi:hypothetical protein
VYDSTSKSNGSVNVGSVAMNVYNPFIVFCELVESIHKIGFGNVRLGHVKIIARHFKFAQFVKKSRNFQ